MSKFYDGFFCGLVIMASIWVGLFVLFISSLPQPKEIPRDMVSRSPIDDCIKSQASTIVDKCFDRCDFATIVLIKNKNYFFDLKSWKFLECFSKCVFNKEININCADPIPNLKSKNETVLNHNATVYWQQNNSQLD